MKDKTPQVRFSNNSKEAKILSDKWVEEYLRDGLTPELERKRDEIMKIMMRQR